MCLVLHTLYSHGRYKMTTLDIGCGNNKYAGHDVIGMDAIDLPGVDVIHDMEQFPYPFEDSAFNEVVMRHSLEHVSKHNNANITIIEEVYRILKPKGVFSVEVPIGQWFHYDPTHKNYVGFWYWKYFSLKFPLNYYTHARLKILSAELVGIHGLKHIEQLKFIFKWLYKRSPEGMERFINFINLDAAIKYTLMKV